MKITRYAKETIIISSFRRCIENNAYVILLIIKFHIYEAYSQVRLCIINGRTESFIHSSAQSNRNL